MLTLVAGPPCAGKTTYVREHARPGDVVLDYDALSEALSAGGDESRAAVHPFALAAFYAVLAEQRRAQLRGFRGDVWVVQCAAQAHVRERYRRLNGARVVVLETPAAECNLRALERFGEGARLSAYLDEIETWWSTYERGRGDNVAAAV